MKKWLKIGGGLLVAAIVIGVIAGKDDKSASGSKDSSNPTTAVPTATAVRPLSAREKMNAMSPADEVAFISAVEAARKQYASGQNDMAKGASRPTRAKAICDVLRSPSVDGWAGIVTKLDTNGDGKGVLYLEIGHDVGVQTWNNSMSDIGEHTLIEASSPLFAVASQLHKGQLIRFGGTFFHSDTDCVHESSMTLSGSIGEPEFIFRFATVSDIE